MMRSLKKGKEKKIDELQVILNKVIQISGVSLEEICGNSRKTRVVTARQFYCWAAWKKKNGMYSRWRTLEKIGEKVGRDHATVLHSKEVINNLIDLNQKGDEKVEMVNDLYRSWNTAHI